MDCSDDPHVASIEFHCPVCVCVCLARFIADAHTLFL